MDCSSITDFQQSTAIRIAKKFRNLHIGKIDRESESQLNCESDGGMKCVQNVKHKIEN